MNFLDGPEIELPRGDVTEGVVRIGDTVRRPHQPTSGAVEAYLRHLERVGFDGAPRFLGRDTQGRDVLTFLEGDVAGDPVDAWARADGVLPSVAALVRRLHDASEGFGLPAEEPVAGAPPRRLPSSEPVIVAQRDVTPQNTVFRDGEAVAVIDFDLTGTTTRATDLVNTALHWVPVCALADRAIDDAHVFARFRAIYDAYGRDCFDVPQLMDAAELRFTGTYAAMKWRAETFGGGWQRMWDEGIGEVITRRVDWFGEIRGELADILAG